MISSDAPAEAGSVTAPASIAAANMMVFMIFAFIVWKRLTNFPRLRALPSAATVQSSLGGGDVNTDIGDPKAKQHLGLTVGTRRPRQTL